MLKVRRAGQPIGTGAPLAIRWVLLHRICNGRGKNLVAEHTRAENPYQVIYDALGISEPTEPRTKPSCCDAEGQPQVDADLAARLETGLAELARALHRPGGKPRRA